MNELLRVLLFLPEEASTIAPEIDRLHFFVILVTIGGAVGITLVGGWFLIRYRRAPHREPPRPEGAYRPPLWFELAAVTLLFTLFLFWWWIGARQFTRLRVAPEGSMEIYVTAKQWMWKFGYPEGPSTIAELYVPVGRPVKLLMTSRDVIHSFYVPEFRVKQDLVPGRFTTAWFQVTRPGVYEILCAEYCGTSHSTMRGRVVALPPDDYARWVAGALPEARPRPEVERAPAVVFEGEPRVPLRLLDQGKRAAISFGCLRCHSLDGTRSVGPTWAGLFESVVPLEGGGTVVADGGYLTASIMDPRAVLHRGFDPVMPSYAGRVAPAEIAGILELIRSLRDVAPQDRQQGEAP